MVISRWLAHNSVITRSLAISVATTALNKQNTMQQQNNQKSFCTKNIIPSSRSFSPLKYIDRVDIEADYFQ